MARKKQINLLTEPSETLAGYIVNTADLALKEINHSLSYEQDRIQALKDIKSGKGTEFSANPNRANQAKWIETVNQDTMAVCIDSLAQLASYLKHTGYESFAQYVAANPEQADAFRLQIEEAQRSIKALLPTPEQSENGLTVLLSLIDKSLGDFKEPTQTIDESIVLKAQKKHARE